MLCECRITGRTQAEIAGINSVAEMVMMRNAQKSAARICGKSGISRNLTISTPHTAADEIVSKRRILVVFQGIDSAVSEPIAMAVISGKIISRS
jgi:hypothetical protein